MDLYFGNTLSFSEIQKIRNNNIHCSYTGCACLQHNAQATDCQSASVYRKYRCTAFNKYPERLFVPIGTYSRFFCGCILVIVRQKQVMEAAHCVSFSYCIFKALSLCALSVGYICWNSDWIHQRFSFCNFLSHGRKYLI